MENSAQTYSALSPASAQNASGFLALTDTTARYKMQDAYLPYLSRWKTIIEKVVYQRQASIYDQTA
jgi:K+-transporting ATPase A subunit